MSKSKILLEVELDKDSIPEKITWEADQKDTPGPSETSAFSLALWDTEQKNSLRIDLWNKEMPVDEMKRFYVDCVGGMAQSILNSTGDEFMAGELNALCDKFVDYLKSESSKS